MFSDYGNRLSPFHEAYFLIDVSKHRFTEQDYDVDYDGHGGETVDPGGSACFGMDGSEGEWELGGVWIGPREEEVPPAMPSPTTSLGVRRAKPQLTITVPSSEDLSHMHQVDKGAADKLLPCQSAFSFPVASLPPSIQSATLLNGVPFSQLCNLPIAFLLVTLPLT